MKSAILFAGAAQALLAPTAVELADNADVLYCFVKEADMRHNPPLPPGDGEYKLFGLQFERASLATSPIARMHDPHSLFGGNSISKVYGDGKTALFFSAEKGSGGDVVLTIAFQRATNGSFHASIASHLRDGGLDDSARFLAGDCKWYRLSAGSNRLFAAIQADKPTLIRGKQ